MKVITSDGVILESSNELVVEQWKKSGIKEVPEISSEKKRMPKNTE